jgi:Short C-terminal domain
MSGATLGGKATSFPYEQVSALELKAGPLNAVLQVHSSAFPAAQVGSLRTTDKKHDPMKLPNCITVPSSAARKWQPHLDAIRGRIARGSWATSNATPAPAESLPNDEPSPDIAAQLTQLAELQKSGALTTDEFERAKKRVLAAD